MTDNEIIKALEICTSEHLGCEDGCPRRHNGLTYAKCRLGFLKDALDLINRQKAEVERLTRERDFYKAPSSELARGVKQIKSEAIKEFEKKFERKIKDVKFTLGQTWEIKNALKDTLKEMTE